MNIGDQVRSIHSGEEGIVRKIQANNIVEIEIEDNFIIPFVKSELVVVSHEEAKHFDKEEEENKSEVITPKKKNLTTQDGIYLCITENEKRYSFYLVNNTSFPIIFTCYHKYNLLECNKVDSKSSSLIDVKEHSFIQNSPTLTTNFIKCISKGQPLTYEVNTHLKAKKLFKEQTELPVLGTEGILFQLDKPVNTTIDKKSISKSINSSSKIEEVIINSSEISNIIDLHSEKLDVSDLNDSEILAYQLKTFERSLDNAIAFGLADVTFIHGVGNGVLRKKIHKELSQRLDSIEYFKDAQKETFGYGATYVKL